MHSRLISWSRYVYLAGIVLALVLTVPTTWFPFQIGKLAVFAVLLFVALFMFALGGGTREVLRAHGGKLALLVGLLPLLYIVSAYFSTDRALALTGSGFDADTILFTILGFLAFLLAFLLFRTLRTATLLLRVVVITLAAAALFQWLVILFGTHLVPFQIFSDRSVNLIGKWNDLGLLAGMLLTYLVVHMEMAPATSLVRRILLGALALALAMLLAVINFALVWGFLLAACIAVAVLKFLTQKGDELMARVPWYALGGTLVSIAFLLSGSLLNGLLTNALPVSSLEVRPSYSSTLQIVDAARNGSIERLFIGTGPATFGESWLLNKPTEVNQSAFWNLDFSVGFSTLVTALGTVGLLGVIAWLVPLVLVIVGLVRAVRLGVLSREERVVATSIGLISLYFFATLIFYVPSQNSIILGLALSGAAFGFLWRQGRAGSAEETEPSRLYRLAGLVGLPLLMLVSLWAGFVSTRLLVVESIVGKGSDALQAGNFDGALAYAARAASVERGNPDPLRLSMTAGLQKLQQLASTQPGSANVASAQTQFTTLAQQVVAQGQDLIALDPSDYRSYLLLGQAYDLFASLKVQGAYDKAMETYTAAVAHNPTNPQIPLMIARLAAGQNNAPQVSTYLSQSLKLKSNYTDAILFLVQLDVAQNDLPSAIKAAQAAAQTAPGVASIWFELGLLYYSAGDTASAIQPLEQAVALQGDYANAKYFLGLSYYAQKRTSDAITQFQDLSKSNPDSTEVKSILSNLQAGKAPFDAAVPPETTPPQKRTTAPINQ